MASPATKPHSTEPNSHRGWASALWEFQRANRQKITTISMPAARYVPRLRALCSAAPSFVRTANRPMMDVMMPQPAMMTGVTSAHTRSPVAK